MKLDIALEDKADKLIDSGRIKINGKVVLLGQKVTNKDIIEIDGTLIENKNTKSVYLAFNKPVEWSYNKY